MMAVVARVVMDEMSRRERRQMVKRAMVSQMRMFVGRRTMAMAARRSEMRRRGVDRERTRLKDDAFSLMDWGAERICQGKWARAATVRVVSRELENVRDEQYHCHGLNSWSKILGVLVCEVVS